MIYYLKDREKFLNLSKSCNRKKLMQQKSFMFNHVDTLMLLEYLLTKRIIFAGRKCHDYLPKLPNYIFMFDPRNISFLNYVFSRQSITSVIRLSNSSIIFTETTLKIKKWSLKNFPWSNFASEFPRNILKVAKIDSREIFFKAQFAKIDLREILGKTQMA